SALALLLAGAVARGGGAATRLEARLGERPTGARAQGAGGAAGAGGGHPVGRGAVGGGGGLRPGGGAAPGTAERVPARGGAPAPAPCRPRPGGDHPPGLVPRETCSLYLPSLSASPPRGCACRPTRPTNRRRRRCRPHRPPRGRVRKRPLEEA